MEIAQLFTVHNLGFFQFFFQNIVSFILVPLSMRPIVIATDVRLVTAIKSQEMISITMATITLALGSITMVNAITKLTMVITMVTTGTKIGISIPMATLIAMATTVKIVCFLTPWQLMDIKLSKKVSCNMSSTYVQPLVRITILNFLYQWNQHLVALLYLWLTDICSIEILILAIIIIGLTITTSRIFIFLEVNFVIDTKYEHWILGKHNQQKV